MKAYRHIFFDLDHTLWDFERNSADTLQALFRQHDLEQYGVSADEFISKYFEINAAMWNLYHRNAIDRKTLRGIRFRKTFEHFGITDGGLKQKFPEAYLDLLPRRKKLLPGSLEVLEYLREGYALHLITNGFRNVQESKLRESGLTGFFDVIVISENTGFKKPEKGIFEHAERETGAQAKDCLMIGDDQEADIGGAVGAGWHAVLFNPGRQEVTCSPTYEISALPELKVLL